MKFGYWSVGFYGLRMSSWNVALLMTLGTAASSKNQFAYLKPLLLNDLEHKSSYGGKSRMFSWQVDSVKLLSSRHHLFNMMRTDRHLVSKNQQWW
jgi:hypothetical protein